MQAWLDLLILLFLLFFGILLFLLALFLIFHHLGRDLDGFFSGITLMNCYSGQGRLDSLILFLVEVVSCIFEVLFLLESLFRFDECIVLLQTAGHGRCSLGLFVIKESIHLLKSPVSLVYAVELVDDRRDIYLATCLGLLGMV